MKGAMNIKNLYWLVILAILAGSVSCNVGRDYARDDMEQPAETLAPEPAVSSP